MGQNPKVLNVPTGPCPPRYPLSPRVSCTKVAGKREGQERVHVEKSQEKGFLNSVAYGKATL